MAPWYQWVSLSELVGIVTVFLPSRAFRLRLFLHGSDFYPSAFLNLVLMADTKNQMTDGIQFMIPNEQSYHNLPQKKLMNNVILDAKQI
jgi:hypothetical protein